jgi:excisionase family DNA binding protein
MTGGPFDGLPRAEREVLARGLHRLADRLTEVRAPLAAQAVRALAENAAPPPAVSPGRYGRRHGDTPATGDDDAAVRHVNAAVTAHIRQLQRDGRHVPPGLARYMATSGHERPDLDVPPPLAVSCQEAARLLGVSVRTVRRRVRARLLPSVRIGRRVLVPVAILEELCTPPHHPTRAARSSGC